MSNTSALEVKIQAVLPESMSSGVMSFLSVTGDWKWMGRLGRLDPGTPEDTQNCASRVLHQTCVRLRLSHSCRENVTAMFRGNFDCSARFARSARIAPLERAYFVVTRGQKDDMHRRLWCLRSRGASSAQTLIIVLFLVRVRARWAPLGA
jgi:hypothetical protein